MLLDSFSTTLLIGYFRTNMKLLICVFIEIWKRVPRLLNVFSILGIFWRCIGL